MQPTGWRGRALVPTLVFLCLVVAAVSSLGAPLVPTLAEREGVPLGAAQWAVTVAFLVGAVSTPTIGRLADGPARRTVLVVALSVVVAGSVLAALPFGFAALLVGRGMQGAGLGLSALAVAIARDHVPAERAAGTISLLSVSAVGGVGLGYPLAGLLAEVYGPHGAFWLGAAVSGLALVLAVLVVPASPHRHGDPFDLTGAALLGLGLAGLLLAVSEAATWGLSARLAAVAVTSLLVLAVWVRQQLRSAHPLVDLRQVRSPAVLTADVTAVFAGVGMYLLLSLVTRYVQTPVSAGYGLGASVVLAGLVLVPFSVGSVGASRLAPVLARRLSPDLVLPVGSLMFLTAMLLFALARGSLGLVLLSMAIAGLGVGCTFAAMPGLIVGAVPAGETASATGFNQVLRSVGYAGGSALSASLLQAFTPDGAVLPAGTGYTVAALVGCGVWVLAGVVSLLLPRTGRRVPVSPTLAVAGLSGAAPVVARNAA